MSENIAQHMNDVLVAIGTRKLENGEIHTHKNSGFLLNFKPVILDHRIAQNLVASLVDLFARTLLVLLGQFNFQILSDADRANAGVAHVRQSALDGFSLRVKHGLFWCDDDLSFHAKHNREPIVGQTWRRGEEFQEF